MTPARIFLPGFLAGVYMEEKNKRIPSIKGQGFAEYVMLIIVVSAALIAMTAYLMRSTNASLKQRQQELNYYKAEK